MMGEENRAVGQATLWRYFRERVLRQADQSRCSLCGAVRIELNREKTKFGVCSLIGCKDPEHDHRAEKEFAELLAASRVTVEEAALRERLAEARWWREQTHEGAICSPQDCIYCKRIADMVAALSAGKGQP